MTIKTLPNVRDAFGKQGYFFFGYLMKELGFPPEQYGRIGQIARHTMKYLADGGKNGVHAHQRLMEIEHEWYDSLRNGSDVNPAYCVYGYDDYLAEVWCCWEFYARNYVKNIFEHRLVPPLGVQGFMGDGAIVDVGNGMGLSTAFFKQSFPKRRVVGTNLLDTTQWRMNTMLSEAYSFELVDEATMLKAGGIDSDVAMVFASEYFEHFQNPLDHLEEMMVLDPNVWVTANAFKADAIGHFDVYYVDEKPKEATDMSRLFSAAMDSHGYRKLKTKLWNNRPAIWIKK